MQVRKVEDFELKILTNLAAEIWYEYWPSILSLEQIDYMVEKLQSFNAIQNQIKEDKYSYYFIIEQAEILGYFGISFKDSNFLFLSKLYIKKEFRHLGYGKKVFEEIKSLTKTFGYNKIQLTVNKYNKNTINAYLKYGFKIIDSVVSDIGSGFVMDDYIMEYSII